MSPIRCSDEYSDWESYLEAFKGIFEEDDPKTSWTKIESFLEKYGSHCPKELERILKGVFQERFGNRPRNA